MVFKNWKPPRSCQSTRTTKDHASTSSVVAYDVGPLGFNDANDSHYDNQEREEAREERTAARHAREESKRNWEGLESRIEGNEHDKNCIRSA
jgi:hypothetical protein